MCQTKKHSDIIIKSKDRVNYSSTTASQFACQLLRSIAFDELELLYAQIPNTIYNITSSNNVIYFNDGANVSATITPGSYTISSLTSAIATAMTSASSSAKTYTVTYSTSTFLLTISTTAGYTLTFGTNTTNSIAQTIGFPNSNTASASAQTGSYAVNLNIDPIYVNFRMVSSLNQTTNMSMPSYSFILPISVNGGEVNILSKYNSMEQKIKLNSMVNVDRVEIELRDGSGNIVNLNGSNWLIGFRYYY